MCLACQEMELYYAYLDALEEEKRKAQPWQCEVTLIPERDDGPPVGAAAAQPAKVAAKSGKPGFVCDDPE
jgi:hypothetical protein